MPLRNLKGITMKMIKTRLVLALAAITLTPAAWSATTATGGTSTTTGVCQQTPTTTNPNTNGNLACGQGATASGGTYGGAIAISPANGGSATTATGNFAVAIGSDVTASGDSSVVVGPGGTASGSNSVALGAGSNDGGQSNVVSVGNTLSGGQRKIINVASGTLAYGSTDAVNGTQLFSSTSQLAFALGGGASATPNGLLPPAYTINGATYTDVGSALQALANTPQQSGLCQYSAQGGIVCGHNTTAAAGAVAQGDGASAGYAGSLAIGAGATILAPTVQDGHTTGAVAIGQGAQANADPATALGNNAQATGIQSVAVGDTSTASGAWSAAVGANATASGLSSTAMGTYAQASAPNTTALGSNAAATGFWSTAVGQGAQAKGINSVAIGTGSVANRPNSVSVGSSTLQRQVTNVAPGTMGTDAVNLNQLKAATAGIVNQANRHADEVAAMAAATSMTPQFGPKGYALTAAVAGVGSQSAVGVGFARAFQFHDHPAYWQASVGFNGGSGTAAVKVGGSIGW